MSIDGMANRNEPCSPYWQVSGGKSSEINNLPVLKQLVDEYTPFDGEVIQFAMVHLNHNLGECGRYSGIVLNFNVEILHSNQTLIILSVSGYCVTSGRL